MAIPDSALSDEQTRRDKSIKIGQLARAFSIFRISRIYIYRDKEGYHSKDRDLLKLILEFLDTPPYLRRILYPRKEELQFAGLLHPLKTPHHKPPIDPRKIKEGEVRQGVAEKIKGRFFVNAGLNTAIPLLGTVAIGKRITIQFITQHPNLTCREIPRESVSGYWGYEVNGAASLFELVKGMNGLVVMTSRDGEPVERHEEELSRELKKASSTLVIFGSPNRGLIEILKDEKQHPKTLSKYFLNFFPDQATETVRLEEAIIGCLTLLNYLSHRG